MKIYYPKDKNGNEIAFRTPENFVYDTTGESLSTKLENLSSSIGNIKGSVSDDVTALDKKFTEAIENRATNSDLEIERRRIDNIANLSSGSTTGDAELIDIRTMTDGTIAANAGTAVRTQIKNLITSESNKTGTTKMTYKLGTEQAMPDIIEYSQLINDLSEEVYSETLSNSGKGYLVDENKNVRVNDIVSVKCDADKQDGLTIVIRYNDGTADKHITTLNNMLITSEMKTIEVSTTKTATFIVKRINSNEKNGLILSAIENMRKELYINLLNGMHLTTGDIGTGGNYVDNDNSYRSTGYSDLSYEKKTEIDHDLPVFLLFTSDYNITIKVFYYEKHTRTLNQSMTKTYTYTSGSRTQIKLLPNYYNKFVFTFNDSNVPSIFDFTKASFLSYEYERFDIQNYIPLTTGKGGWEWKNINTAIAPYVEPRLANITNRLPLIVNQVDELKGDFVELNKDLFVQSDNLFNKDFVGSETINGNVYTYSNGYLAGVNINVNTDHEGEFILASDRWVSYPILVNGGDTLYFKTGSAQNANTVLFAHFYDADMKWIGKSNLFVTFVSIPSGAKYMRVTQSSATITSDEFYMISKESGTGTQYKRYFPPFYGDAKARELANDALVKVNNVDIKVDAMADNFETIDSRNRWNPQTVGNFTYNSIGEKITSTDFTSDLIEAKKGDTVHLCAINKNGSFIPQTSMSIHYVTMFDANRQFIKRSTEYVRGYEVPEEGTAYIAVTVVKAVDENNSIISITINDFPTSANEVDTYKHIVTARDVIAREMVGGKPNNHIIECWGDSRTEMVWADGSSYSDVLQNLLGANYIVTNHGISSQSSGLVTGRMGVNELFVSVDGSTWLNDTGSTNVNLDYCSCGDKKNVFAYSETATMDCELCGVRGKFTRTNATGVGVFTPDDDGTSRRVRPRSKLIALDTVNKSHIVVAWFGKNDLGSAGDATIGGVLGNYKAIADYLGHDKFLFLGETYSMDRTTYAEGSTYRTRADGITNGLKEAYPNNSIDIQAELINRGLSICGLTPTEEDTEWMNLGFIPPQLMVYGTDTSDVVHPNAYGRQAIGKIIYDFMVEKGMLT